MTNEEKRQLAEMLAPHLAWDLSRSELFSFDTGADVSGVALNVQIEQVIQSLRAKLSRGESFVVAIIPKPILHP